MRDGYDYYPCKVASLKGTEPNVVAILDVNYGNGKTGTIEYKPTLSSISSNGNIITLKTTTNPLYLRIPNKKSKDNIPELLLIWKTSKNRATF